MLNEQAIPVDDHGSRLGSHILGKCPQLSHEADAHEAPPSPLLSKIAHKPVQHRLDDISLLGPLGRGNMGSVFLVLSHSAPYALKITHSLPSKKQRSHVERDILASLHHPLLQSLHAHFEFGKHSIFLLDFCSGGDLNLLRHKQPEQRFSETAARFYAAEVLVALEHLHELGIVYRDLKPENVLVQGNGHIKLTDFDLSMPTRGAANKAAAIAANLQAAPVLVNTREQHMFVEAESEQAPSFQADVGLRKAGTVPRPKDSLRGDSTFAAAMQSQRRGSKKTNFANKGCNLCQFRFFRRSRKGCLSRRTTAANCRKECTGKASQLPRVEAKVKMCEINRRNRNCTPGICCSGFDVNKECRNTKERYVCVVGTDEYVAPEVLKGDEQGFCMDWWSFGIFLYEMIYGYTPFRGPCVEKTLRNILEKEPEVPGMRTHAKHLLTKLLVKDPSSRLGTVGGAKEIKQHPFFGGVDWESLSHICRPPFLPRPLCLSEFEERGAKFRSRRDACHSEGEQTPMGGRFWLEEVVERMEAAERYDANTSSQYSPSSSAGFQSSGDGGDRKLQRGEMETCFSSSAEWSS